MLIPLWLSIATAAAEVTAPSVAAPPPSPVETTAAAEQSDELVLRLYEAIVNDDMNALAEALKEKGPDQKVAGNPPLMIAVSLGQIESVRTILDSGADVNVRVEGRTPLMLSLLSGYHDISLLLIERGANVMAQDPEGITAAEMALQTQHPEVMEAVADRLPKPPLTEEKFRAAAEQGDLEKVREGLKLGFSDSTDSDGWTALMLAVAASQQEVVEVLVNHLMFWGLDAQTKDGYTALMIATAGGNEDLILKLLRAGADLFVRAKNGVTAYDMAVAQGLDSIAAAFKADVDPPQDRVRTIQRLLTQFGHDPGPIDGALGPSTNAAIREYHRKFGLRGRPLANLHLLDRLQTREREEQARRQRTVELLEKQAANAAAHDYQPVNALGLDLTESDGGLIIRAFEKERSPTSQVLRIGDKLIKVGGKDVKSIADVHAAIGAHQKAHSKSALLLVERDGGTFFVGRSIQ